MYQKPDNRFYNTRRMRFRDFDYTTPGYYFVTICEKDRRTILSDVVNDNSLELSPAGVMVQAATLEIPARFMDVLVDALVVMPNHVHLLIGLNLTENAENSESLIDVVHWWKTVTTKRYVVGVKEDGWSRFDKRLWQTGYHDRIVRDNRELDAFRYYIQNNPSKWVEDTFFED